jgi:hypothetical protein
MKTTPRSLNFFQRYSLATLAIAFMCLLSIRPAQAGFIVTLKQVGSNVVATGSGAIDLTGLNLLDPNFSSASGSFIDPSGGVMVMGPTTTGEVSHWDGTQRLFPLLGSGGTTNASSGSGDRVGLAFDHTLYVPVGYVSGSPLSDTSTYDNATFSSLGVKPGIYKSTWGTGVNQNFTLKIGTATVPDSGSAFGLFFVSLIALLGAGRYRSRQLA